jgi:S-adenosylmethionine-dependent methyltransferase
VADEQRRGRRGGVETALRTSAVWSSVDRLASRRAAELDRPLRVLDLGGGTGGLAVPLAERGHLVTVVDPSPDALASLSRRSSEAGVAEWVTAAQGDADTVAEVLGGQAVDLVCCHGTLEVVDDPQAALSSLAAALSPGGYLSIVAAQRLAAVLARVLAGQFDQAHQALVSQDGRWGAGDPLPRRFDQQTLEDMVARAGFTVEDAHGVRLFSDLVPSTLLDSEADRAALLTLEQEASRDPRFPFLGQLGAALHLLASRL